MSWLDWAIDDPAPPHCGYSGLNIPCEIDPSLRYGIVIHSVEGWFTHVNPSAVMQARGNSWGVTIMRNGQVWRHRPRPTFVNWHAGGPAQNIGTDGIEMEGKNQPWTKKQRISLVQVLQETREWLNWPIYTPEVMGAPTGKTQESIRQALLGWGYGSLWEHNWFDYTSCPSGRNDWSWLMPELQEAEQEEDVPVLMKTVKGSGPTQYATDGVFKMGMPAESYKQQLVDLGLLDPNIITVSDEFLNWLASPEAGGGDIQCRWRLPVIEVR